MDSILFPLIAVFGPTGAGKSQLAIRVARELGGEILNCDSVQVYRGLDIGSAKVSIADRQVVAHHLIDLIEIDQQLSAGEYGRLARAVLQDLRARNTLPVVAGGTGFYLRALLEGLSPAPSRNFDIRQRLAEVEKRNPAVLHRYVRRYDPAAGARIHANDLQKLIRAIELMLLEKRPLSETQSRPREGLEGFSLLKIGLLPPRADLYRRINVRSEWMFASGLLEETANLLGCYPSNARGLLSLGYKQAIDFLQHHSSLQQAIADCQTKTRQYAKRQMTWFRREKDTHWLHGFGDDPEIQRQALALSYDHLAELESLDSRERGLF